MQKNNPIFAETGELLNKEAMIKKELKKIKSIYKDLDLKRKKNAESLMNSAAFMAVSMMELEHIINLKGYTEEKRKTNILNYIQQNNTISTLECRSINGCSKYIALKDLRTLLDEQKIVRLGYRANAQYGLKTREE